MGVGKKHVLNGPPLPASHAIMACLPLACPQLLRAAVARHQVSLGRVLAGRQLRFIIQTEDFPIVDRQGQGQGQGWGTGAIKGGGQQGGGQGSGAGAGAGGGQRTVG